MPLCSASRNLRENWQHKICRYPRALAISVDLGIKRHKTFYSLGSLIWKKKNSKTTADCRSLPVLGIRDILVRIRTTGSGSALTRRHNIFSINLIFCWNFVLKSYFASIIAVRLRPFWLKGWIWIRTSGLWIRIPNTVHNLGYEK